MKLSPETQQQIEQSVEIIRASGNDYVLAQSGGKDSAVLDLVAALAGVRYRRVYNRTTVDPPQLVRHVLSLPGIEVSNPEMTMWELILHKLFPPDSRKRWCCEWLKHSRQQADHLVLTGIRAEESQQRSSRRTVESCRNVPGRMVINPLLYWKEWQIWETIRAYDLPYCSLYDQGFHRLGCICCPLQGTQGMIRDALMWPGYARAYIRTYERLVTKRRAEERECTWQDGMELFFWWLLTAQQRYSRRDLYAVRVLAARWGWRTGKDFEKWVRAVKHRCAVDDAPEDDEIYLPLVFNN